MGNVLYLPGPGVIMTDGKSDVTVNSRKGVHITGVDGIISFSSNEAVLSTSCGYLAVSGEGFRVEGFDREAGEVKLEGKVNAVFYPGRKSEKKSFWSSVFR